MITSSKTSSAPAASQRSAQRFQEPRRRRDAAHVPGDRLDDDRRQPLAVALDGRRDTVDVVVVAHDRVRGDAGRDAGRARDRRASRGPSPRDARNGVGVPVVAAGERDHAVAMGQPAREPHARTSQPRSPTRRAGPPPPTAPRRRSRPRARPRASVARPNVVPSAPPPHRLDRLGVGVPEDQRPPRLHPVAQRAAVGRLDVGAVARARTKSGWLEPDRPHRADGRVHAAGDQLERAAPELAALRASRASPRAPWPST